MILMPDRRREALAAYAHQSRSVFVTWLLGQGKANKDGSMTLPPELVQSLRREAGLLFPELTAGEQDLARHEADRILLIAGSSV